MYKVLEQCHMHTKFYLLYQSFISIYKEKESSNIHVRNGI